MTSHAADALAELDELLRIGARTANAQDLAHRQSCVAATCDRCERFQCIGGLFSIDDAPGRRCAGRVEKKGAFCAACALDKALLRFEARIPPRFRWALRPVTRDDSIESRVLLPKGHRDAALIWAERQGSRPSNVYIVGPSQQGKTSLAVAMLGAWFCANHARDPAIVKDALFVDALELSLARGRHRPREGGHPPLVDEAIESSLLVLDDLGQDRPDCRDDLKFVVRKRHNEDRPTWITTWHAREKLAEFYSGSLIARLVDRAPAIRFEPTSLSGEP